MSEPVQHVDVQQMGAAGDGITDDTAAIQRAIARAAELGVPVYFPPGRYAHGGGSGG